MVRASGYVVLILFLLVLFSFTSNAQGLGLTITGGVFYATFEMEEFNASIHEIKTAIEADDFINDEELVFIDYDVEHMEPFSAMPGFFIELQKTITDRISIGGQYEYLQTSTDLYYNVRTEHRHYEEEIISELLIEGGTALLYYHVNEYLTLNGGVGYYLGQMTIQGRGSLRREGVTSWYQDGTHMYLEDSIGYRAGATINYPITPFFSINASTQYRLLEMRVEVKGDEYFGEGLTSQFFHGLNGFRKKVESDIFNGFVLKGGLSFHF